MAEKDKKYYWLKLKRDFFKRHDIQIIEDMPNGKDYILFYLKLLCESVDHEGNLRFNEQIPYNEQMLSTITRTNIDVVRSAIKVFESLKMLEILDDGTYYMNEVNKILGSETYWAERKRIQKQNSLPLEEVEESTKKQNVGKFPIESNEFPTRVIDIFNTELINNNNKLINSNINEKDKEKIYNIYLKEIEIIITYLNLKTNKHFTFKNKTNNSHIIARLKENYSIEDFKKVIDNKCKDWLGTQYEAYLRPETLFSTKFDSYLNCTTKKFNPSSKQSKLYEVGDEI